MEKYTKGTLSPGLSPFLYEMKTLGYEFLTHIVVNTKEKKVSLICEEFSCILPCEIGANGYVGLDLSKSGDGKTPTCETKVRHIDLPINNINNNQAATISKTKSPYVNFGPCFVCLYITDPETDEIRGIGFHGSEDDTGGLLPTDGCIRLLNADLYSIRKLFFKNLKVSIV